MASLNHIGFRARHKPYVVYGGVDVRKFELTLNTLKPIIRQFHQLYKKKPDLV